MSFPEEQKEYEDFVEDIYNQKHGIDPNSEEYKEKIFKQIRERLHKETKESLNMTKLVAFHKFTSRKCNIMEEYILHNPFFNKFPIMLGQPYYVYKKCSLVILPN